MELTTNLILDKKINSLPKKTLKILASEYEEKKLNTSTGWVLGVLGFHYLHTQRYGLRFLYLITCFVYVGWIRWIIQLCVLKDNLKEYNEELLRKLYNKYN